MRVVVSYPGVFQDAQQAARAFHERSALVAFVTGLVMNDNDLVARLSERCLPESASRRLRRQFARRIVTEVPAHLVISYPWLDAARTALSRYARNPVWADVAWDALSQRFDATVARRHLHGAGVIHAFEYTAKATFVSAKSAGIATVLGLPSLDSREFEDLKTREEGRFPELKTKHHDYFARRFARRYERRCAEIALADVVVANSELTRRSHIRAGADPRKIVAVPLAAPPPIAAVEASPSSKEGPLSVVWAGTVSIRKGAHYFIEAWRRLRAGRQARACVYGKIEVPERVLRPLPDGVELLGPVPQRDLFAAFAHADVLVFPTLSDGFGGVVLEAFSRGLPVITTASAGAAEFVTHGTNGLLVPAGDSAALTDALRWCLDNREALYRMRFAALDTARGWQWSDYRAMLIAKITEGLRAAGHGVDLGPQPLASDAPFRTCASAS
jgi:glycosyltransferase involved in cell wall biosynthesis